MATLKIDPEFRDLIPPLTEEEREMLEDSILKNGCETPLTVWDGVIVDGHNRYEICQKHGIPFAVTEKDFEGREDALLWIITNQLGRRNLTSYQRGELMLRYKPLIAARSEQGKRTDLDNFYQNSGRSVKPTGTDKKLAQLAGVSHDTIHKVKKLSETADAETKQRLRRGEVSINKAYTELMYREHADKLITCGCCGKEKPVSDYDIPSNRHGFSSLCRSCEREITDVTKNSASDSKNPEATAVNEDDPGRLVSSGAPKVSGSIHTLLPLAGSISAVSGPPSIKDRASLARNTPDVAYSVIEGMVLNDAAKLVEDACIHLAYYKPQMFTPERTARLRQALVDACEIVEIFDTYIKENERHA